MPNIFSCGSLIALYVLCFIVSVPVESATNAIQWGVNIPSGGSDPTNIAEKLAERNLKCARMALWANDAEYLTLFTNAVIKLNARNIRTEAVVFTEFSAGQSREYDTNANLIEVEQTAYDSTKPVVDKTKNYTKDYELQNEVVLYHDIQVPGTIGTNASDFNTPAGRLQVAVLRGMCRAIDDVRKSSGLPLRIILGTVDRRFAFLSFMQQQGVSFDVIGYHIYPWENNMPLDQDPWYGAGGPLGQLAKFNKPVHINEYNAGEIYSGGPVYPTKPNYENQTGQPVTEAGFLSFDKHLKEIVNQTVANIESVIFYEIWDQTQKAIPENRFGLYYDKALKNPKISLLIASSFAGGFLSPTEQTELTKRGIGLPVIATPIVAGVPADMTTNRSFTISLMVNKNYGYWKTNASLFNQFTVGGTNIAIDRNTTFWYYGASNGVSSATNSNTYKFDTTAPTATAPMSITTNAAFSANLSVNENWGYWSTNGIAGPYIQFTTSGTSISINSTTTLYYFGRDVLSNTSATNTCIYTINAPPVVSGAPASCSTNKSFTITLTVNTNYGYYSTNSSPFVQFTALSVNIPVDRNMTLRYYGSNAFGVSATNSRTYTFDTIAPIVTGAPESFSTNREFRIILNVNENSGYVSMNGGSYSRFETVGTNIHINSTATLSYFGRDSLGNTSVTNTRTYNVTIITRLDAVTVFYGDDGVILSNLPENTTGNVYTISGLFILPLAQCERGLIWNKRTKDGRRASPGVYLCQLVSPMDATTKKVIVNR